MDDKMKNVYQKFYSSINLLSKITSNGNYIDNISYIDSFLSEFRNITFVLQKQFSDKKSKNIYVEMRDTVLVDDEKLNKLVDFRDEIIHEKPFDLGVEVVCSIYLKNVLKYGVLSCNVDDKLVKRSIIEKKINNFLRTLKTSAPEIYFTYEVNFISNTTKIDIMKLAEYGINKMFDFLNEFEKKIYGNNDNYKVIKEKILKKIIEVFSNKFKFSVNGVYLVKQDKIDTFFLKARIITIDKNEKPSVGIGKTKLEKENIMFKGDTPVEKFKSFVTIHLALFSITNDLAPVFAIVYEDGECEMICNMAFSKADLYEAIFTIVDKIKEGNIKYVILCQQMIVGEKDIKRFSEMTYEEKMKNYDSEGLAFSLITKNDSNINIFIPVDKAMDIQYVMNKIDNNSEDFVNYIVKPIEDEMKKNGLVIF